MGSESISKIRPQPKRINPISEKFRNKFRNASIRLKKWDYRWSAAYFVTICTHNRECYFGEIVNSQNETSPYNMQLSPIGAIANVLWYEMTNHAKNVELDAFVVMPNHIHRLLDIVICIV